MVETSNKEVKAQVEKMIGRDQAEIISDWFGHLCHTYGSILNLAKNAYPSSIKNIWRI